MENIVPKWPYADQEEIIKVSEVLKSNNWWRNSGVYVKAFENEFAQFHDCLGAVSTTNGTVAIEVALKALNIGKGDEVIVPAFTFYSTISAVMSVGATPVIVDVLSDTFCINPDEIKKAVSYRTKAIIVVHIAGQIAEIENIVKIAKENNVYVIEDSAHAHGAVRNGRKAGSFGICGTFSFQNAKLMTAGEGGIVVSNDNDFLHKVFLETNCGREENDTNYEHILIGTNARLSEVQGAILQTQLKRVENQIRTREQNYKYLCSLLEKNKGIRLQRIDEDIDVNPHYMIMFYYDKKYFKNRERHEFISYLKENGIPANRAFESLHRLPVFGKMNIEDIKIIGDLREDGFIHCNNSEDISENVVCIHHNVLLGDYKLMDWIADTINLFC